MALTVAIDIQRIRVWVGQPLRPISARLIGQRSDFILYGDIVLN